MADVVIFEYNQLANGDADLTAEIERALGPHGMGLLLVKNVPGYVEARRNLLPLARQFANLPEQIKEKYVNADSRYNVGWSHGKEAVEGGKLDIGKGSYYANPTCDQPTTDAELIRTKPEVFYPNIWPGEDLPALEPSFKSLARIVVDTAVLLAKHCDKYVHKLVPSYQQEKLARIIASSKQMKARLLYYFPPKDVGPVDDTDPSSWCGWHHDHGSITGLTSAMFFDAEGHEIPNPEPRAGLYAQNRAGEVVKINIPTDCLAFQIGEAAMVHTGGRLIATPHCVKSVSSPDHVGVGRATFAVFTEPEFDEPMDVPEGVDPSEAQVGAWVPGQTFGEFGMRTYDKYYGTKDGSNTAGGM